MEIVEIPNGDELSNWDRAHVIELNDNGLQSTTNSIND